MKYLLLTLLLVVCTSDFDSVPVQSNGVKSLFGTEIEGYKIYKIRKNDIPDLYLSKCTDSSSVQYQATSGKSQHSVSVITYGEQQ